MFKQICLWACPYIIAIALLAGCSSGADDAAQSQSGGGVLRAISGTSAIGRAGSWSNNCLAEACVRADNSGNFLLATEVAASDLMYSDIPNADGSTTRLYSRYRLNDDITTTMVNINPSTHAIMDMWANFSQRQSIDLCAQDTACTSALIAGFTEQVEDTIVSQLDALLADAWPAGRNPFSDIYIANREDPLDAMHDFLNFVVSADELVVYNNNDEILTRASLDALFRGQAVNNIALSLTDYENAQRYPPLNLSANAIQISIDYSPTQPVEAPAEAVVNVSGSSSPNGELSFTHDLTTPAGTTTRFTGDVVTTSLLQGGNHVWVVTATDEIGNSRAQGVVISLLGGEDEPATFGNAGSCLTPASAMNANMQNICIENQNGQPSASCDTITASSITLIASPAPCAHQIQNDGELLGICTLLYTQSRTFYYQNPQRPNNVETPPEKQARLAQFCREALDGSWSLTP